HNTNHQGAERQSHSDEREVEMCSPNLSLHIKCMANRVEEQRVQDQSYDIDQQHTASAHACTEHPCQSLPKPAHHTRCYPSPHQPAEQSHPQENDQVHQKHNSVPDEQPAKTAKSDQECDNDEAREHEAGTLHKGISNNGTHGDASGERGKIDRIITETQQG